MGSKIQAVIFDCFGVMITDGLEALIQSLEKSDPAVRDFISGTIKLTNTGLITPAESNRRIAERVGIPVEDWISRVSAGEVRNDDLLHWIVDLRKDHKTGMISNVGSGSLARRFTDEELRSWFDVVVVSADVGVMKPDPAIYRIAAERLDVPLAACVFIDDREVYAEGARQAGMKGVYYQSYQQAKSEVDRLL